MHAGGGPATLGGDAMAQPTVVITGASRGIGLAVTRALCAAGYGVVAGVRAPRALPEDARLAGVHYLGLDLTDSASIAAFAAAAGELAGSSLLALVNNAGVGALGAAETFPPARARRVLEVNLWGALDLTRRLLPRLRARAAPGRPTYLLNVGSLIAEYPVPYHAVYAASKGALRAYTLALRGELAAHGVAVVLLEPGDVATGTTPVRAGGGAAGDSPYAVAEATVEQARARKMEAAPPPEAVAARVLAVLGARRPPPIVACGGSAPLLRFARRLLPDRAAQALTLRSYGLGSRGRPRGHRA